jgi:hypothetical protein
MAYSYVRNCYLVRREGDPPFLDDTTGELVVKLDGYAVVPLEEYSDHIGNAAEALNTRSPVSDGGGK